MVTMLAKWPDTTHWSDPFFTTVLILLSIYGFCSGLCKGLKRR